MSDFSSVAQSLVEGNLVVAEAQLEGGETPQPSATQQKGEINMTDTFTVDEFRAYLSDAKARLAPFRRSRSGIALYYEHKSAWKILDAIKSARAALRNASEEAEFGIDYERGGSALNTVGGFEKFAVSVRRNIEKHFAVLNNVQDRP